MKILFTKINETGIFISFALPVSDDSGFELLQNLVNKPSDDIENLCRQCEELFGKYYLFYCITLDYASFRSKSNN